MKSMIFNVNGIMYRPKKTIKHVAENVDEGDYLTLDTEPGNKYDKFAVKVFHEDIWIGYVERDYSEEVSELLESGKDYECKVISCFPEWDVDFTDSGKEVEVVVDIDLLVEIEIKE